MTSQVDDDQRDHFMWKQNTRFFYKKPYKQPSARQSKI